MNSATSQSLKSRRIDQEELGTQISKCASHTMKPHPASRGPLSPILHLQQEEQSSSQPSFAPSKDQSLFVSIPHTTSRSSVTPPAKSGCLVVAAAGLLGVMHTVYVAGADELKARQTKWSPSDPTNPAAYVAPVSETIRPSQLFECTPRVWMPSCRDVVPPASRTTMPARSRAGAARPREVAGPTLAATMRLTG